MCLFKQDEIKKRLAQSASNSTDDIHPLRIVFSPTSLNHYSIDRFADIYSRVSEGDFDTVVIVESQPGTHEKKLPMPSHNTFSTRFGDLAVNKKLRNELCDEDDDFFIDDEAYSKNLSLFDQLLFIQNRLKDFSVLSIQITDESPSIVKELSAALEEILASRNALLVFCCDIHHLSPGVLEKIVTQFDNDNRSGLINTLNSDGVTMNGAGSFLAGLLIAEKWKTKLTFTQPDPSAGPVSAFAEVQFQPIPG
ncbi:AmmeMemoRadiSam system protein B [Rhodohalobacter sp. 8-1]|uniref:AmmeMemoRadiSam system protein B n=1 Tax=Rhodohalobacter sp. 8-1 TaxID=3131972 RepID=UPI0030EB4B02